MINITLDSRYKIQSDRLQWILVCDDRNVGFFQDLNSLVQEYVKEKLRTSNAKTFTQLEEFNKQSIRTLQRVLTALQIKVEGKNSLVSPKNFEVEIHDT